MPSSYLGAGFLPKGKPGFWPPPQRPKILVTCFFVCLFPKGPTSVSSGHQADSTFFETPWPLDPWVGGGALQRPKQAGVMPFTQLEVGGTVGLLVDRREFSQPHRKSIL